VQDPAQRAHFIELEKKLENGRDEICDLDELNLYNLLE
jgi:hypothetical protein